MDSVEAILPRRRLLLEDLVVRRELHGGERVEVLAALGEEIVPTANEAGLVLVVDEVERVVRPSLLDLRRTKVRRATASPQRNDAPA